MLLLWGVMQQRVARLVQGLLKVAQQLQVLLRAARRQGQQQQQAHRVPRQQQQLLLQERHHTQPQASYLVLLS